MVQFRDFVAATPVVAPNKGMGAPYVRDPIETTTRKAVYSWNLSAGSALLGLPLL